MTNRTRIGVVLLMLALGLAGCGGSATTPIPVTPSAVTPSPVAPPPNGFLFVRGTVSDTAFRLLPRARVEVIDGPQAGLSTMTDAKGEFSLTGTFDDATRFRTTKDGYVSGTRTLQRVCFFPACNPNGWINFSLEVLVPAVNMAGDYTVTFIADSACAALANEVRTRTYTVTIPSTPISGQRIVDVPVGGARSSMAGTSWGWASPGIMSASRRSKVSWSRSHRTRTSRSVEWPRRPSKHRPRPRSHFRSTA